MTSSPLATRRSRLDFAARSLQPTHVRTGTLPGYICINCSERAVIPEAVYRQVVDAASAGPAASAASDRMSMRQPVSRAASRAFCPSFPMASDSW
jgi:hypothetical protein